MMSDVDKLNERLQRFAQKLAKDEEEEKKREEERKRQQEEEEKERLRQQQEQQRLAQQRQKEEEDRMQEELQQQPQQQQRRSPEPLQPHVHPALAQEHERKKIPAKIQQRNTLAEKVKLLKLHPKFDVTETRDSYIIATYVPGMRDEDITVHRGGSTAQRTLTIEGVRVPTQQEEAQMRQLLRKRGGVDVC